MRSWWYSVGWVEGWQVSTQDMAGCPRGPGSAGIKDSLKLMGESWNKEMLKLSTRRIVIRVIIIKLCWRSLWSLQWAKNRIWAQVPFHPACAERKYGVQPPSIWLLPEMIALLKHPRARLLHLFQGLYGAKSPKPTSFLVVSDPHSGDLMEQALVAGQLPPPLQMGRTSSGYATNPLKRYFYKRPYS